MTDYISRAKALADFEACNAENQPTPSGKKVALLDLSEVQESMEGNINE